MPQLRQNIITGEWVVIAPERSKRPTDFITAANVKEEIGNCPFCASGPSYKKRLPHYENHGVYVFPNKFPAFLEDPKLASARINRLEGGFYNARPSTGGHDVIAIKDHNHQLYDFPVATWIDLLEMTKKRYHFWRHHANTAYSMLIYNQGVRAGASITHPHAQIFASNIIPNHISKELLGAQRYYEDKGACVFCDLIKHEQRHRVRIVEENDRFIAFTFYAARFPFETWVMPKKHIGHFEDEPAEAMALLSAIMRKVIGRIGDTLSRPSLNFFIHDLPTTVDRADYFHWHIEIAPRVATYGGFELGSGTIIDVIAPEDAARYLRAKK